MNCLSKVALCCLLLALCSLSVRAQGPLRVSTSDGATTFNGVTELVFPPGSVTINGRQARVGVGSGGSGVPGSGVTRLNGMLGTTQTFSSVNDTNLNLTIASASNNHAFTLSWSGALGKSRQHAATVYNDQANTYTASFLQSFFAGASNFELKDASSPTKKFTFDASNITAGTTRVVNIPDVASSTTAQAKSAVSHFFFTAMSAQGVFTTAQPACGDLSDASAFCNGTSAASLTGSLADARLSANVPLLNAGNSFTNDQEIFAGPPTFKLRKNSGTTTYQGSVGFYAQNATKGMAIENNFTVGNDILEFNHGSSNLMYLHNDGGLVIGSPTGGSKGSGSLNATGIWLNGTALGYFATGTDASNLTGTLNAARLPTSVPTSIVNDTNVTGSIASNALTLGWTGTLASGRLNSNVVQAITNDTNVTGSISAQNLTLAWTGTLASGRLNSNVVQAITNDTNVTGSISAQNLTLAWTGTLASGRLNSNVVQAITNDTNVTGSISAQNLTLAWTGTLAKARQHSATVYNDQANTYTVSNLQSFFAGSSNIEFKDPTTSSKKFTFDASNISASTTRTVNIPDANSTTAQAKSAVSHFFFTAMSAQGVFTTAQPACGDLSDASAFCNGTSAASLTGSLADARLSANVPLINAANIFTNDQTIYGSPPVLKLQRNSGTTTFYGSFGFYSSNGTKGMALEQNFTVGNDILEFNHGASNLMYLHNDGGLVIGAPTGGSKGSGSLNAVTVWRNGTALDSVFSPNYKMLSIDQMKAFYLKYHHLPTIPTNEVNQNGSTNLGALEDRLWETVEVQARMIAELNDRLKVLEGRQRRTSRKGKR